MDGSPTDDLLSNPSSADDPSSARWPTIGSMTHHRLDDVSSAGWPIIGLMNHRQLDDPSSAQWPIISSMTHHHLSDPIIISVIQSSSQWSNHRLNDLIIGSMTHHYVHKNQIRSFPSDPLAWWPIGSVTQGPGDQPGMASVPSLARVTSLAMVARVTGDWPDLILMYMGIRTITGMI